MHLFFSMLYDYPIKAFILSFQVERTQWFIETAEQLKNLVLKFSKLLISIEKT